MDKKQINALHNFVYSQYKDVVKITFKDLEPDDFYSYIISKEVVIPLCTKYNQTEWTLFAFLHEIGHVMTNTSKMKRCLQEYLATQWAIEEAKKIGFIVPKSFLYTYQMYIWRWRDESIKHKGKNVPTKEELTIII